MKTLKLRVEQQAKSAMEVARFLQKQECVEAVYYPGLESHKNHEVAKRQMSGFGVFLVLF